MGILYTRREATTTNIYHHLRTSNLQNMQKFTYPLENKTQRSSTRKLFLVIRCLRGKKRRKITVNINDEKTIAEKHEYQNNWNNNRVKFDKRGKKFRKIFDRNYTVTKPRGEKMAKKTKYKMKKLRRKKPREKTIVRISTQNVSTKH